MLDIYILTNQSYENHVRRTKTNLCFGIPVEWAVQIILYFIFFPLQIGCCGCSYGPVLYKTVVTAKTKTLLANCQRNRLAIALRHKSACYIAEVLTFINFTPNQLRFIGSLISNYMFLHRQKLHLRLPLNYDFMLIRHARYHLSYLSLSCSSGLFSYLSFQINWKQLAAQLIPLRTSDHEVAVSSPSEIKFLSV